MKVLDLLNKPKICLSDSEKNERITELKAMVDADSRWDNCQKDDNHLCRFLGICDYNVRYAYKRYSRYQQFRQDVPEWLFKHPPEQYDSLLRMGACCILEGRDKYGRKVYFMDTTNMKPSKMKLEDKTVLDSLWMELVMDDPETQRLGVAMLMDIKNISVKMIKWFTLKNISRMSRYAETSPLRHMEVHVINTNPVINSMIKMVFPFLSSFIKDRIFFHNDNYDALKEALGVEVLPQEYNGTGPKIDCNKQVDLLYKRLKELAVLEKGDQNGNIL